MFLQSKILYINNIKFRNNLKNLKINKNEYNNLDLNKIK